MTKNEEDIPSPKSGLLMKLGVACVFLGVMIAWQNYYFLAIDDVDGNGTTLWNWPAFVLIAFGIAALIFRIFRFARRRGKKSENDQHG